MGSNPTGGSLSQGKWLNPDVLLICFSAFFADLGYQAVSAVFPLLVVVEMGQPAYVYGVLLSFSYGIGSVFSLLGGRLGDKHSRKTVSLIGNLFIPLMSLSVLSPNLFFVGLLFVLG